jgi:hypothetical protein
MSENREASRIHAAPYVAVSRVFFFASAGLFVTSLTQYCFWAAHNPHGVSGLLALLLGWVPYGGINSVSWFANPLFLLSWILIWIRSRRYFAIIPSLLALALALSFLAQEGVMLDEGGGRHPITRYGPGYWLWIASIAAILIGNIIQIVHEIAKADIVSIRAEPIAPDVMVEDRKTL